MLGLRLSDRQTDRLADKMPVGQTDRRTLVVSCSGCLPPLALRWRRRLELQGRRLLTGTRGSQHHGRRQRHKADTEGAHGGRQTETARDRGRETERDRQRERERAVERCEEGGG